MVKHMQRSKTKSVKSDLRAAYALLIIIIIFVVGLFYFYRPEHLIAGQAGKGGGGRSTSNAVDITASVIYLGNPERCGIPTNPADRECTPGIPLDRTPISPNCDSCRNPIIAVAAQEYKILFGFGAGNFMPGSHMGAYHQIAWNAATGKFKWHPVYDTKLSGGVLTKSDDYFVSAIRDFPDKTLIAGGDIKGTHDGEDLAAAYIWDHSSNQWLEQPWIRQSSEMTDIIEWDGKIFIIRNIDEMQHGDEKLRFNSGIVAWTAVLYSIDNGRTWKEVFDEYDPGDLYKVLRGKSFLQIGNDLYLAADQDSSPWYKYRGVVQTADGDHRVAFEPVAVTAPVTYQGSRAIKCGDNTVYIAGKTWKTGTFSNSVRYAAGNLYVGPDLNNMKQAVLPVASASEILEDLTTLNTSTGQQCAAITHTKVKSGGSKFRSYIYVSSDEGNTWVQKYFFDNAQGYIMSAASLGGDLYFGIGNVMASAGTGSNDIGSIYRYHVADVQAPVPVCIRANPTIYISPGKGYSDFGQSKSFDIYVTNHDLNCPPSAFSLTSQLPQGLVQSPASQTITLASDASLQVSVAVTASGSAAQFSEFTETFTNMDVGDGAYKASATAKLTLGGGCPSPPTPPTVTISPRISASGFAGQRLFYFTTITNNNPLSCSTSGFSIDLVTAPAGWSATEHAELNIDPQDTVSYERYDPFLSVVPPANAQLGTYQIVWKVMQDSAYSTNVVATYIVLPGTPPTVTITTPPNNSTVTSAKVDITATASSPYPIQWIKLYENGRLLKSCPSATSCTVSWSAYWYGSTHIIVASSMDSSPEHAVGNKEISVYVG